jgi:VWFA-related protein
LRKLGFVLLIACALSAQAQVRESVTVEVVQVPVYVTTSDGKPVTGLTKDAFQLSVDGHPQPIEYFDTFDFGTATGGPAPAERTRRERRLYLLLFDLSFATPGSIGRAQRAAEQAVMHSNPATDLFAVATYSSNKGVFFLSPFLSDRVAVTRAIYTLKSSSAQDPLGIALASAERAKWVTAMEQGGAVSGSNDDLSTFLGTEVADTLKGGQINQDNLAMPAARLIEFQLEGLGDAAARFASLEGQKHVLIFTEGFESTRINDIKAKGRPPNLDAHLVDLVKRMHDIFVSAGVTLDSVDIKGLRHTFSDLDNNALYMLSQGTGGRVIDNRNDLVAAVDTLVQSQRTVYLLGFRQGERKRGRISVRVNGLPRGAEVSYREGFGYVAPKAALDSLQLADILLNDVPQAGVALSAGVRTSDTGAEVAVSFARAEVVPQLVDASPGVEFLFYIFNDRGGAVGFKAKRINFTGAGRVNTGYLTLNEPFDLPKGKYSAKVLLRISGTKSLGFVRRDFTID